MPVVASAPGKVLITGGYLILERPNSGIVLSTSARFYAIVKPLLEEVKPESWVWGWTDVKLSSPQLSREVSYKLSLKHSTLHCTSSRGTSNPFVEQAVQRAIAAVKIIYPDGDRKEILDKLLLKGLDITIIGANDFYSFRNQIEVNKLPLLPETLATIRPFSPITYNVGDSNGTIGGDRCRPEVAKTGLGSSAAMTTSVVAALLHYLGVVNLPMQAEYLPEVNTDLDLVHIIAQSAHCIAQGKIGSGFDVSAAVYGSQRYIRFSPEVLSSSQVYGKEELSDSVANVIRKKWDHEKSQFSLPPLMNLLLGEPGSGGSSTPSMVGAVKQWQKSDPQGSQQTWSRLAEANLMLETEFRVLSKIAQEQWETYKSVITSCSLHKHGKWMEAAADRIQRDIVKALMGAREAFIQIRFHLQQMGKSANIPIEPESQTLLLDTTMNMEGVLLAGVPGAGGFDAVFAITLGDVKEAIIESWSSSGILPLLVREDPHGVRLEHGDPRVGEVSSAIASIHIA